MERWEVVDIAQLLYDYQLEYVANPEIAAREKANNKCHSIQCFNKANIFVASFSLNRL